MYDVWALEKENDLPYGSGDYRTLVKVEADKDAPETSVISLRWVRIAHRVDEDIADQIMDQYPHAARAK